jgi:CubicO group peptidase (beta-lactamase class C family)
VDLDAPVTTYVPYFRLADPRYKTITVRQMLTHSSGMPDVEDYEWNKPQYDDDALSRYVKGLADQKLRLLFDPGTGMSYSNMAYEVLGDLVAHVSGMPFEEYVDANILQPLGMKSSTLLIKKADPALLADGYMRKRGGDYASLKLVKAYPYNRIHTPSSNLMSNVSDMTRYAMANLNHGELDGTRILKASTYDLMWKPAVEVEFCQDKHTQCRKPGAWVGISWFTQDKDGQTIVSHSGGDDGFMTNLVLVPRSKMGLVLMTNALALGTTLPQKIVGEFLAVARENGKAGS